MDVHAPDQAALFPAWVHVYFCTFLDSEDCRRHGQALDLRDDYLSENVKQGKENAAPATDTKPDDNWPQVEIRVANKRPGLLTSLLKAAHICCAALYLSAHNQ